MAKIVLHMIAVLTVIGLMVGGVLSSVNYFAAPLIEANRLRELKEAIFYVLPEAKDYETIVKDDMIVYKGIDENGNIVGYSFTADGPGYQANIKMMVGLRTDLSKLNGMKVLEQLETPGLGNYIEADFFQDQFKGLEFRPKIEYVKNREPEKPNQIEALTGATISSKAVTNNINNVIMEVIDVIKVEE
jgi:electron transport complex protein RnfG